MSQKKDKMMRKILRDKILKYNSDVKEMMNENARIIKHKPSYIPMFLWLWMLSFFINMRK